MKVQASNSDKSAAVWDRAIEFRGKLTPAAARVLLQFQFSERDHARMTELSTKAQEGRLAPEEQAELDTFERLGCLLDIVHSKARTSLPETK